MLLTTLSVQVRAGLVNSTAVGLDICNLNNKTNQLCQILKTAQVKIAHGNCIFAGACAPQLFVYTPGMYSSSNNDFVRGTVADFYEMFKQQSARSLDDYDLSAFVYNNSFPGLSDEDHVCPMDDMELALKLRNEAMKQKCASVQLDNLKTVLMALRMIVDTIIRFHYILMQIVFGIFRLLMPGIY